MTPFLLHLPQELLIEILSNTDPISLVRCAAASKALYHTLHNSSRLLCITEMYLDGLESVLASKDHAKLLEDIICHRRAWRFLEWTSYHCIPLSQSCKAYELVGGVFAQTGTHNFQIVKLPTQNREKYTIDEVAFGFAVRDFAMDPTQDVIALLEDDDTPLLAVHSRVVRIHIRTISTNIDHPLAPQSPLEFDIAPDPLHGNGIHSAILQIACDMISIYITRDSRPRVLIWNWIEGRLLYDSGDGLTTSLPLDTSDFSLLDRTSFLITCTQNSGSIALYKLHLSPFFQHILHPLRIATFHLPSIKPMSRLVALSAHAGPIEANPLPDMHFKRKDRNRLHIFTLSYSSSPYADSPLSTMTSLGMYVHQNVFASYLEDWEQNRRGIMDIKWEDWGPNNTRLMQNRSPSHWLRYVHGQRVICSTGSSAIEALDFSLSVCLDKGLPPAHELRGQYASGKEESLSSSATKYQPSALMPPTVLEASPLSAFETEVETRLPCCVTTKGLPSAYYAYMLYENGIIGVQMRQGDNLELHVYTI